MAVVAPAQPLERGRRLQDAASARPRPALCSPAARMRRLNARHDVSAASRAGRMRSCALDRCPQTVWAGG